MLVLIADAKRVVQDPVWKELYDECLRRGNAISLGAKQLKDLRSVQRVEPFQGPLKEEGEEVDGDDTDCSVSDCKHSANESEVGIFSPNDNDDDDLPPGLPLHD